LNYWSTPEFGFLDLEYRGGSFMMPQKNSNQAYLERTRVGAAKMLGYLTDTAAMSMRCPHGDMVEMLHMQDGPIHALDAIDSYLHPMIMQLHGITVFEENMLAEARRGYSCATELANQMVRDFGIDYRTAHKILHEFVVASEAENTPASQARADLLDAAAEAVLGKKLGMTDARLRELLDPAYFIKVTNSKGGIAPQEVARMITERREKLAEARTRNLKRIEALEKAQQRLLADLKRLCQEPNAQQP
jgi:argininosuccinate lyase